MKRSSIKILVWDVPTRVFHWSMVLCFIGAWLMQKVNVGLPFMLVLATPWWDWWPLD